MHAGGYFITLVPIFDDLNLEIDEHKIPNWKKSFNALMSIGGHFKIIFQELSGENSGGGCSPHFKRGSFDNQNPYIYGLLGVAL